MSSGKHRALALLEEKCGKQPLVSRAGYDLYTSGPPLTTHRAAPFGSPHFAEYRQPSQADYAYRTYLRNLSFPCFLSQPLELGWDIHRLCMLTRGFQQSRLAWSIMFPVGSDHLPPLGIPGDCGGSLQASQEC